MFEPITCAILQQYTTSPPLNETKWYGPWFSALSHLFPLSQNYVFTPLRRIAKDDDHTPYFIYEVSKFIAPPSKLRTVLIVAIMDSPDWQAGIPLSETEINRLTDTVFSGALSGGGIATSKVYWIVALGPHWRYGIKEDNGRELKPLIDWHDTIHDQAPYDDFQRLAALIAALVADI
jgi:hypothetical protein